MSGRWPDGRCARCGAARPAEFGNGPEAADPCLGELPGVTFACCGHGLPDMAYVVFDNGVVLRGFDTVEFFDHDAPVGDREHVVLNYEADR